MDDMSLTKHPRKLLVIIAESLIESLLIDDVMHMGAHGYTVTDVRGRGASGTREGNWEADRTIRMDVVCDTDVADQIGAHILEKYARHYGVTMYFSDVQVFRPEKF